MGEEREIYWIIGVSMPSILGEFVRYYTAKTSKTITFKQLMSEIKAAIYPNAILYSDRLIYSNGELRDVVINNDKSLKIAIEYMGEDAHDIKKGIVVSTRL
ncbi:hypothetical protein EDC94DRAFT_587720 [Helicostylum pulchrum]|nr:hypothetical protein EDC94DRAFT_587720 [Helicostylum pulchrum]